MVCPWAAAPAGISGACTALAWSWWSNRVAVLLMIFALWMLVVAFMSFPPKRRKRGRPKGTDPARL